MKAWESFIEDQEREIGSNTVQKWLKTLKIVNFDAGNLYLEAKDTFHAMWFEEHMRHKVDKLFNNNKRKVKVHLSIENVTPKTKSKEKSGGVKKSSNNETPTGALILDELDPHCTFENFCVSEENLLTYTVLSQLAEKAIANPIGTQSDSVPNPIYIHGAIGSGKSHLLIATATALRKQGKKVVFSRAQTFTDHVVSAIRAGEMSAFRQAYRNCDVLIIDDVQVFSRKGATQEEFFHTFNSLQMSKKLIILSANCSPKELQLIEPRLISRFEWGIVLSLEAPSRVDAEKILITKSKALDFPLHNKVIDYLLDSFRTMSALIKALNALILRYHLMQQTGKNSSSQMTVLQAKAQLNDLLIEEEKSAITTERIIQDSAEYFGIRPEDISGKAQTRDCVLPRQLSMYLCRKELKLPYLHIGEVFSRDHSTVMSSVKVIQQAIDADNGEVVTAHRAIMRKLVGNNS